MSFIQGFQVRERLYESKNSLVLRAIRDNDGLPVVIKILKNDYPTTAELARYRREFEITHSLDLPGVIRSYELRRHEKTLLIVFEDFGGMSIGQLLRDRPLSSTSSWTPPFRSLSRSGRCTAPTSSTRTSARRTS